MIALLVGRMRKQKGQIGSRGTVREGWFSRLRGGRRLTVESLEQRVLLAIDSFTIAPSSTSAAFMGPVAPAPQEVPPTALAAVLALPASAPVSVTSPATSSAASASFALLHSFNTSAVDGDRAVATPIKVGSAVYGTTIAGGAAGQGAIYSMNLDGTGFQILHSFTGADGANPYAGLTLVGTTLYGITGQGGDSNEGVLYEMNLDGSGFQILHAFSGDDGAIPLASLTCVGSSLYGTTIQGGDFGAGAIFSINLDGSGFQVGHSFTGDDGASPLAPLVQVGQNLYGTASEGGGQGYGSVFAISLVDGSFQDLYDFTGDEGGNPTAPLTAVSTTLYGTASQGGANGDGTIFALGLDGANFRTLHTFSGSDGVSPSGLLWSGFNLFGETSHGGDFGNGNVYAFNLLSNSFQVLHSFAGSDGQTAFSSLSVIGSSLMGATVVGGDGGGGTVFSLSVDGTSFQVLHSFGASADGRTPTATLTAVGATLYGVTSDGGSGGQGTVFSIEADGSNLQVLHSFGVGVTDGAKPQANLTIVGGTIYGTTRAGGAANQGLVYALNLDGSNFRILHSFTGSGADGGQPLAGLTLTDSTLVGTTSSGGTAGGGTVFSLMLDGTGFQVLHSFAGGTADGFAPRTSVVVVGGALVGTTSAGGSAGAGTVFSLQLDGSNFRLIHIFGTGGAIDGSVPTGLTLIGSTIYGTATGGGAAGKGTIFSLNADGTNFQILHAFAGKAGDGRVPTAPLISVGASLYGTTSGGGPQDGGVLFSIAADGSNFQILHAFAGGSDDGQDPTAGLALIDSTLYGVTTGGGAAGMGTVFALTGAVVLPAPQVALVQVASSHWSPQYLANLQAAGSGDGRGYAIPVGTSAQLAPLSLANLDQILITFTQDVTVEQASLTLQSVNVEGYAITGFSYDPATFTAVWTLAQSIDIDTIAITLSSSGVAAIRNSQGDALDGEWSSGTSQYPSGNNSAGGDFQFRFNVLPGDGNHDGIINGLDIAATASHWLQADPSSGDANGDGMVNGLDVAAIASHWAKQSYKPTQVGAGLDLLLDPNVPTSMTFRPVRSVVAAQNQAFTRPSTGPDDVFAFQGDGTASKFMVSGWFRFDSSITTGEPIIGMAGPDGTSWKLITTGPASLEFVFGDSAGAWGGYEIWTNAFNPGSQGILNNCWLNLVFIYDGSQTGDENIARLYINGAQVATTPGNILPALVGNPSGTSAGLAIGGLNGQFSDLSFCDVALSADVPVDDDAAVAALWNNGFGLQFAQWPSSCPALTAYYSGNDNATGTGTAPAGDLIDATGSGYNLTAINGATGSLQVVNWQDLSPQHLLFEFGYDPATGYRSRVYEAQYSPTVRGGLPGVVVPGLRASGSVKAGYAYAPVNGIALMGSSGSMFGDFILNTTSTSNDLLSVCDDQTHAGDPTNGITQVLALGAISENVDLINLGNYSFANLHTFDAEGYPAVQLVGPGDIENSAGNEIFGLAPDGIPNGSSIVPGNTYIPLGQQTSLMLTNTNDGSYGGNFVPGPYQIYVNNEAQVVYVDDGGAGRIGNIWAATFSNLNCIVLNGYSEVTAGVAHVSAVNSTTYGPMGISALLTDTQQAQLRRWLLIN